MQRRSTIFALGWPALAGELSVRPQHGFTIGMFTTIYDLREDDAHIAAVQRATLTTRDFGLVPEHGLFGSPEWWQAVEDGRMPVHTVDGVISRVFMKGHNDWPEIEVEAEGKRSSWTRNVSRSAPPDADAFYAIGRRVRVQYVVQRFKRPLGDQPFDKTVLYIGIAESAPQPSVQPAV